MIRGNSSESSVYYELMRFYREMQYSLIKRYNRPLWYGYATILLEYYIFFFIAINRDVVNLLAEKDPLLVHLKRVAIGNEQYFSMQQFNIVFLAINAFIVMYIAFFIVAYFMINASKRAAQNNQQTQNRENAGANFTQNAAAAGTQTSLMKSTFLSVLLQSYSAILFCPSLYFALKDLSVFSYINIPLATILGFISSNHQSKFQFRDSDSLSKFSNVREVKKWLLTSAFVIACVLFDAKYTPIAYICLTGKELVDWAIAQSYLDTRIGEARLQFALSSFALGLISLGAMHVAKFDFAFIATIVSFVFTFKVASLLYRWRNKRDNDIFIRSLTMDSFDPARVIRTAGGGQLDFFIRMLWKKINTHKSYLDDSDSILYEFIIHIHVQQCQRRPFCFCQEICDINAATHSIREYLMDNSLRRQFILEFMHDLYKRCLSESKRMGLLNLSYLYFLSDCLQNPPLLRIQLYEYHKRFSASMSSQQLSTVEHLIALEKVSVKSEQNIHEVVLFEEEIEALSANITTVARMKQDVLRAISQNHIDLISLEKQAQDLHRFRKQIYFEIRKLFKINSDSPRLVFLASTFFSCLSFEEKKDMNFNPQHRGWRVKRFVKNIFSRNSSVIFVSLSKEEFGIIKNVSNSFMPIFNYSKNEVIGQNCSCIMPKNIAVQHDAILANFINRGKIDNEKFKCMQPFYILNRQGFLVSIEMDLQMTLVGQDEIGVSGLISSLKDSQNDHLALLDIRQDYLTLGCTHSLFTNLLSEYVERSEDCKSIYMTQMFPMLPLFVTDLLLDVQDATTHAGTEKTNGKHANELDNTVMINPNSLIDEAKLKVSLLNSQKIETLLFLPRSSQSSRKQTNSTSIIGGKLTSTHSTSHSTQSAAWSNNRLTRQPPADIKEQIESGQFSLASNDLYLVTLRFSTVIDEFLSMCKVSFRSIKRIETYEEQMEYIHEVFLEQVSEFRDTPLNYSNEEVQRYFSMTPLSIHRTSINLNNNQNNTASTDFQSSSHYKKRHQTQNFSFSAQAALALGSNRQSVVFEKILEEQQQALQSLELTGRKHSGEHFELSTRLQNHHEEFGFGSAAAAGLGITAGAIDQTVNTENVALISDRGGLNSSKRFAAMSFRNGQSTFQFSHESQNRFIDAGGGGGGSPAHKTPRNLTSSTSIFVNKQSPHQIQFPLSTKFNTDNPFSPQGHGAMHERIRSTNNHLTMNTIIPLKTNNNHHTSTNNNNNKTPTNRQQHSEGSSEKRERLNRDDQNAMNNAVHGQHSITSSKNSQDLAQKKLIRIAFSQNSNNSFFQFVVYFAFLSIMVVGVVIVQAYLDLKTDFTNQQKNFSYIPWGVRVRVPISRTVKDHHLERFLEVPEFGFTDQSGTLSEQFQAKKIQSYYDFRNAVLEVVREPIVSLFIINYLTTEKIELGIFKSDTDYVELTTGMMSALNMNDFFLYQLAVLNGKEAADIDRVAVLNVYNNFLFVISKMAKMQTLQENNVADTNENISAIVTRLLWIICLFSAIFTMSIFPVYSYSKVKTQRILSLFATIDPAKIKDMHRVVLIALAAIERDTAYYNKQHNHKKHKLSRHAKPQKSQENLLNSSSVLNIKESSLFHKNKSIASTSFLPRHSIPLFFKCGIIYLILIAYPIINFITTNTLISQSENNQGLSGILSKIKGHIASNMAVFTQVVHTELNLSNDYSMVGKYKSRYSLLIGQDLVYQSQLQQTIQKNQPLSRYNQNEYDEFFFNMLLKDACSVLKEWPQYSNSTLLSVESCEETNFGILSSGILTAISTYFSFFVNAKEIFDLEDLAEIKSRLFVYLSEYNLLSINQLCDDLLVLIDFLTAFISTNNSQFYGQMETIQTALMIYQFVVLIFIFRFGFVSFFRNTANDLYESRSLLTVLQISYLASNPYIMNFIIK